MTVPGRWTGDECRDVMSAIPIYVWSALPDGEVDFVNPEWEEYTGLPASAAFGWKWQSVIHREDVERYTSAWRFSLESLEPLEQEIRVLSKNGVYRWWLIRCSPIYDKSGQLQKWYGAGFDINERKRVQEELQHQHQTVRDHVEQELRNTIDAIPVLCGTMSSDGNVDFFNRRTLEFYGLSSEEMIGFNWKNVVHPADLPRLIAAHQETLPSGLPLDIETRCRRADGEYRWLLHRMVPRYDEHGQIIKIYGISIDIEDRKRAEEAVLEQRISERTRIARDLHDTLLQNFQATLLMLGAAKNLLDGGAVKDALEQVLITADRAIAEGREAIQGLRLGTEDPEDLITVLTTLGKGLATGIGIAGSPVFHVEVSGVPARLHPFVVHEVVGIGSEVIRNAFRHARAKHIRLHFRYEAEDFWLAVVDDGTGIDPTILAKGRGEGHFGLSGIRERAKIVG